MDNKNRFLPGLTLRSLAVLLFGMFLVGAIVQFTEIVDGSGFSNVASSGALVLPIPAMAIMVALLLLSAGLYSLTRMRLLTRPELLCVTFGLFCATPIMSVGVWDRFLGTVTTVPVDGDWEKYAVLRPKMWPHGPNLIEGAFDLKHRDELETSGDVRWEKIEYAKGESAELPILRNQADEESAWVRLRVPVRIDGKYVVRLGEQHMVNLLLRPHGLGTNATYSCTLYADDVDHPVGEIFASREPEKVTVLQPFGFRRDGIFATILPTTIHNTAILEFTLRGRGELAMADPQFMSMLALRGAYAGRKIVTEAEYDKIPENERCGLIVKPAHILSMAGLRYVLTAFIPVEEWRDTVICWGSYILMILLGTLAIAAVMRKQWIQSERFPLPNAQIPLHLIGLETEPDGPLPAIWRDRMMWTGFAVSLVWCLLRVWGTFNPSVPQMAINVQLSGYFGEWWGKTFAGVTFTITAVFLSLALFMELNVLLTIVVGYFLYRAQMLVGKGAGWDVLPAYPFQTHQQLSGFLTYAVLIVVFTRKYLWRTVCMAVQGRKPEEKEGLVEPMSYRAAYLLLIAVIVGLGVWSRWMDLTVGPMLVFFLTMLAVGFVAMKVRAECGVLFGAFTPGATMLVIGLVGGLAFFTPSDYVFATLASAMLCWACFFLIPGQQLEFLHLGRRNRVRPRHLFYVSVLSITGGFLIGGWGYLSSLYSLGETGVGNRLPYTDRFGDFTEFTQEVARTNSRQLKVAQIAENGADDSAAVAAPAASGGGHMAPEFWMMIYAAAATTLVTVLRQIFAGFWFHPIGIVLGASDMMQQVWGSVLAAWAIRYLVLKLGGAATVRTKLLPFAVGMFVAAMVAFVLMWFINGFMYFFEPGAVRRGMFF
jgi:hypothetical protein